MNPVFGINQFASQNQNQGGLDPVVFGQYYLTIFTHLLSQRIATVGDLNSLANSSTNWVTPIAQLAAICTMVAIQTYVNDLAPLFQTGGGGGGSQNASKNFQRAG